MLKVSFKDDYKDVVVFYDKVTVVTLIGLMGLPKGLWEVIPEHIVDWAWQHPSVDVTWGQGNSLRLESSGKSVCAEGDTFEKVLGERIAESRAKIRIYKFMYTLTDKLCRHFYALVYGKQGEANGNFVVPDDNTSLYLANKKYRKLLDHERHHLIELLQQTVL